MLIKEVQGIQAVHMVLMKAMVPFVVSCSNAWVLKALGPAVVCFCFVLAVQLRAAPTTPASSMLMFPCAVDCLYHAAASTSPPGGLCRAVLCCHASCKLLGLHPHIRIAQFLHVGVAMAGVAGSVWVLWWDGSEAAGCLIALGLAAA